MLCALQVHLVMLLVTELSGSNILQKTKVAWITVHFLMYVPMLAAGILNVATVDVI